MICATGVAAEATENAPAPPEFRSARGKTVQFAVDHFGDSPEWRDRFVVVGGKLTEFAGFVHWLAT